VRLALLRSPRRIEFVGEGTETLGDDPIGARARFGKLSPGLLLGVVDHFGGGLLGRLDDRGKTLGRTAGQRAGLGWAFPRAH
jgi:hypothetical protein